MRLRIFYVIPEDYDFLGWRLRMENATVAAYEPPASLNANTLLFGVPGLIFL
jgi:hypothetical protein